MADLFCSRNLKGTNFSLRFFLPSNHCSSLLFESNKSRIANGMIVIRRRRRSLHLRVRCEASSQTPSSTKLDVISTHEHRDGSLVFRFGDPIEAAKNVESEKPEIANEEDEDISTVQESEHKVKEADSNDTDSLVVDSSKSDAIVELEREDNSAAPTSEASIEAAEVDSIPSFDTEKEEEEEEEEEEQLVEISSSEDDDAPLLDKNSDGDHSKALLESSEEAGDNVVRDSDVSGTEITTADVEAAEINEAETSSSGAEGQTFCAENEIKDGIAEDDENGAIEPMKSSHLDEETGVDTLEESEEAESLQSTPVMEELEETEKDLTLVESLPQNLSTGLEPNLTEETAVDKLEESDGFERIQTSPVIEESSKEAQETDESPLLVDGLPHDITSGSEIITEEDAVLLLSTDPVKESGDEEVAEIETPESSSIDSSQREIASTRLVLSSGAALLPHPSKEALAGGGGEDAYFIGDQRWLGVADGASRWSFNGTDPGLYGLELMNSCQRLVSDSTVDGPVELLSRAVDEVRCPGSSTVVIALLDGQALRVVNIGNSGFFVVRNGCVHVRSTPMLHAFHFPLQIERGSDVSRLAESYRVDLEEGDVLVTSTDGLLDNLFDHEISSIVANSLDEGDKTPEEIAEALARRAREIGMSGSGRSPFADGAREFGFAGYEGGKLDDVAVIVSFVQKKESSFT